MQIFLLMKVMDEQLRIAYHFRSASFFISVDAMPLQFANGEQSISSRFF